MGAAQAAKEKMHPHVFSLAASAAALAQPNYQTNPIPQPDTWLRFAKSQLSRNSHPGDAPPTAVLYPRIGPAISNTATGFHASEYDFRGRPGCTA
jgi:hypothetical protein